MRTLTIAATFALALYGCGKDESQPPATQGTAAEQGQTSGGEMQGDMAGAEQGSMSAVCPMEVQGTTVQAENVEGGAALVFVTTGDVDDLRERVRHYAAMQEAHSMREGGQMGMSDPQQPGARESAGAKASDEPMSDEMRGNTEGTMGGAAGPGEMDSQQHAMPQVNTRVEDIEGGARLVIIPMDSGELDTVRSQLEEQAQVMNAGECQMTM